MSINELVFYLFIILVPVIIYLDRKNIKIESKIIVMRRTQKGKSLIEKIAYISKPMWNFIGILGIFFGIIASILVTVLLFANAYEIISGSAEGSVSLVFPGPVETSTHGTGITLIPITYWLLIIPLIVIPHEFFHGIMCRIDKIRIKSVGWAFFLVVPGAFVEQHEKDFKKAKVWSRLKVAAAGSMANFLTAALAWLILIFVMNPMLVQTGALFEVIPGSPAYEAGVEGIVSEVNGKKILTYDDYYGISDSLENKTSGDIVEVKTFESKDKIPFGETFFTGDSEKSHLVTLGEREGSAYLGLKSDAFKPGFNYVSDVWVWIYKLFYLILVFGFGVGLINMLPMKPLDGGYVFEDMASFVTKKSKQLTKYVSIIMFILLIFNIFGNYFF